MSTHNDKSRDDIIAMANDVIRNAKGLARVYFNFTCRHCGQRCTLSEPNTLYESGECFKCGKETIIEKAGFMLMLTSDPTLSNIKAFNEREDDGA